MADQFSDYGVTTVAGGSGGIGTPLNATDTTLRVPTGAGAKYPATGPFMLQIGTTELAQCSTRSADVLTIARGQEGTTAATWPLGTTVQQVLTAGNMNNLWSATATNSANIATNTTNIATNTSNIATTTTNTNANTTAINNATHGIYNVLAYGAVGDGVTDCATAINNALSAANTAGGGVVYLPAGTYLVGATLTLYSLIHLRGDGPHVTIIKLKNAANVDVIQGASFATLTGTNNASAGINEFSIENLTVDANKANNTSGYGIRLYGYNYLLSHVQIQNATNDGLYSEWARAANVSPVGDSLEARLFDVKSHDNKGHGITWAGPHDSLWDAVITYQNGTADDGHAGMNILNNTTSLGGRLQITNSHSWGNSQSWALRSETQLSLSNNQWEGAQRAQVLLGGSDATHTASDTIITGDTIYAAGTITAPVGIEIGITAGSIGVSGLIITGVKLLSFTSGALKFTNDAGLSTIDAWIYQASGTVIAGTPASGSSGTKLTYDLFGLSGSQPQTQIMGHAVSKGGAATLGTLKTGINTQSITGNDTAGTVTLATTATPPGAAATVASVVFATAYAAAPQIIVQAASTNVFVWTNRSASGFDILCTAALGVSASYFISYLVIA